VSWGYKARQEVAIFPQILKISDLIPTNSCKFPTEEIIVHAWVLKILILWGFSASDFEFLEEKFRPKNVFSTIFRQPKI